MSPPAIIFNPSPALPASGEGANPPAPNNGGANFPPLAGGLRGVVSESRFNPSSALPACGEGANFPPLVGRPVWEGELRGVNSRTGGRGEVCVGAVDSIPAGQGRAFQVGGQSIAVFRQRSGKLNAIQNICPHRGGPLSEGILGADTVICPLHSWKFDVQTGECHTETCIISSFPVRQEHGNVYIRMDE